MLKVTVMQFNTVIVIQIEKPSQTQYLSFALR